MNVRWGTNENTNRIREIKAIHQQMDMKPIKEDNLKVATLAITLITVKKPRSSAQ